MNSIYDIYHKKYEILIYKNLNNVPFKDWIQYLDNSIKARIELRIKKFEKGSFGDIKIVSPGVYEARFFFGSGYRIYFSVLKEKLIILLCGGDKSSQTKDIKLANQYLKNYLEAQDANTKY